MLTDLSDLLPMIENLKIKHVPCSFSRQITCIRDSHKYNFVLKYLFFVVINAICAAAHVVFHADGQALVIL